MGVIGVRSHFPAVKTGCVPNIIKQKSISKGLLKNWGRGLGSPADSDSDCDCDGGAGSSGNNGGDVGTGPVAVTIVAVTVVLALKATMAMTMPGTVSANGVDSAGHADGDGGHCP